MTAHHPDDGNAVHQRLREAGVIAVLRMRSHAHAAEIAGTLAENGVRAMEVTFDHPDSATTVRRLREVLPGDVLLGAGTVRTRGHLDAAVSAGAAFCVSPGVDADLVRACRGCAVEPLPGAATATEVATALDAGARMVKLFPAGPLGVGYLRALRAPFPDAWLVPTGGVAHSEVETWLRAGAAAVGLGSDLVPPEPTPAHLPDVAARARLVRAQVRAARER